MVVSPNETTIYIEPEHDLANIITRYMRYYPLVIAEGFRGVPIGKAIAIVENEEELQHVADEPGLWFIVSHDFDLVSHAKEIGFNAMLFEEVESIVGEIYKDSLQTLLSSMPSDKCREYGYSSCVELAEKLLRLEVNPIDCVILSEANIVIDDRVIKLDPRMQAVLKNIVRGFIMSVEGIPPAARKIRIEIKLG